MNGELYAANYVSGFREQHAVFNIKGNAETFIAGYNEGKPKSDHLELRTLHPKDAVAPFQYRVLEWLLECFGPEISADKTERNHRFLEEALELVQAAGCTHSEAVQLVEYVFSRPTGEINQECGGVMVTLAALCSAHSMNMLDNGEIELARVWTKVDAIRAKQSAKPKHSPLPQ